MKNEKKKFTELQISEYKNINIEREKSKKANLSYKINQNY